MPRNADIRQLLRYVINGLVATGVHFAVLTLLVEVVHVPSKGVANLLAAAVAIVASFLGNRLFVFAATQARASGQLWRFVLLYAAIALLNGGLMALWSDVLKFDYRVGFVLISIIQFILSFLGNRLLVFKP
ncbi:GtrA family protein [Stenotrophomonas sp. ISL-67]|uniref:GtrA family protein n=1 Tax=Stenotrophomonas sp. ISL-67 TaxID=2819171 RepID=UPI001BE969BA|nr:GtrA family protein [Stenotrophomonas sp. ISL-67]MBT2768157.1 GtrA family protein [Stenotrophomonas sp. ISL-67]